MIPNHDLSDWWSDNVLWWHKFLFFSADTSGNLRGWGLIEWEAWPKEYASA